jgi:diguanylate cyclase (GGDEF)-like protein/PAS domain S-box-containing protein
VFSRFEARPYGASGRLVISALLVVFALLAGVGVGLSLASSGADSDRAGQAAILAGVLVICFLIICVLVHVTRRQVARLRTMFEASSELVFVLGEDGCRYVSRPLAVMAGRREGELAGTGLWQVVHEDDRALLRSVQESASPVEFRLRLRGANGEWHTLEVRCNDLRSDRQLRGVLLAARDMTERVRLEQELLEQTRRDAFATQLAEALEMADEEEAVYGVIERTMAQTSERTPMELLLSDSSRANMRRVASNNAVEPPGCGVKSPYSCVAVRRGSAVVFESSELLNACPQLQGRAGGACSAVCVPISFMGRSLGVLHTTGENGAPLAGEQVERLKALATQAGARIGTVRAFERTQLQASTDGLTGLVNRRSAEARVRDMLTGGHLFAFAIADLDNFKALNDAHGHEAGDRALRLFAQTTQEILRDNDLVARWGGEEFVIVLPELDRLQAINVLERVRLALARAELGEAPRFTASMGVSDSNQADSLEHLVHIADGALYAAKQAGRDCVKAGEPGERAGAAEERAPAEPAARAPAPQEPELRISRRRDLPRMHDALHEDEPRPSGREIR